MKKLMTVAGLFLLVTFANAQWYQSYGVTNINELTAEQCKVALKKANNTTTTGAIMTLAGITASVAGYLIINNDIDDIVEGDISSYTNGMGLMYAGAGIAAIGIPLWISGATRKSQIEVAMVKFKDTTGLGFKIKF